MDKFNGLKMTSFLMGVCLPLGVVVYMISSFLNTSPRVVQETTQEQVKLAESYVSMFSVIRLTYLTVMCGWKIWTVVLYLIQYR